MEEWNELWSFENIQAVQTAAAQTLKNCGISLPRGSEKIAGNPRSQVSAASFGVSLRSGRQPTITYKYGDHGRFKVPRFLVEAAQFLEEHSSFQGIFRKAGSVSRQKALRASLDSGNPSISPDANVHDVASLLKQYLRELPEPLITAHLLPVFEACYSLPTPVDRQRCLLLACLFLPQIHLECLCVLMKLLHCVSESSSENLMDASNLAIVLAPNIIRPNINFITPTQGNPLKNQTGIVQILIESAPRVGCVPSNVYAVKKPAKVDILPPVQNHIKAEVDVPVHFHKKPEIAVPVSNHITEEHNGRNVRKYSQGNVSNSLDNVIKIPKVQGSELRCQKSPDNVQKVPDIGVKAPERVRKVHNLPENGLKMHKLQDMGVKAPDGVVKTKSENFPENRPKIESSLDSALRVRNHQSKEEKGVEPVVPITTAGILNEEEHPVTPGKEIITSTSWTGSLLFVSLIGLLVLIVAFALSKIMYVW